MGRASGYQIQLLFGGLVLTCGLMLGGCSSGGTGCKTDADCPGGRYCAGGACTFDCTFDADCPQGYRCGVRGDCERYCSGDADCAADLHCDAGACVSDCGTDAECQPDEICSQRGRCEPACTPTNGGAEACDGLDNDCDDETDEDWPDLGAACANGACPAGAWVCGPDGQGLVCDGPQPADDDAACNGLDDDCDGATDEDALTRACPLQAGVCAGAVQDCLGGAGWSACDYGPDYSPDVDATCDGLDEDCDGATDEDAAQLLVPEDGVGAGDGLDNNCNGLIDEPGGVMVPVPNTPGVWVDAYESVVYANPDCTGLAYGQADDDYPPGWPVVGVAQIELYACSLADLVPSGHMSWYRADRACRAQGKRLCARVEWQRTCSGDPSLIYPYGMVFVPGACNDALGGLGQTAPAGSFAECTGQGLTYDLSGNLGEWVLDEDPQDPGYYSVGGYGYECLICRHGNNCAACVPEDPGDEDDLREMSACDLNESARNDFPPDFVLPSFGARCCMDGP